MYFLAKGNFTPLPLWSYGSI